MENLKKIIVLILIAAVVSSCLFDRQPKDVNPFYTKKYYLDYPAVPLSNPVFVYYVKEYHEWFFEIPDYFENKLSIKKLTHIGVDRKYVYGKTNKKEWNLYDYEKGEFVYAKKYSGITITKEPSKSKDYKQIHLIDSIKNTFIEPERWFIINVADSTTEAFFSKTKYDEYLKERGISGKMYNIDKYHKQFIETGILPWFPDSIKVKLKK